MEINQSMIIILILFVGFVIYLMNKMNKPEEQYIPENVSCPFCKKNNLDATNPITFLGWLFIIIGLFFSWAYGLGLILVIIGCFVREKKFYCNNCQRSF